MFLDNKEELNEEETKFVEDPANAGLFDDPSSSKKKRTRDDQPSPNSKQKLGFIKRVDKT